MKRSNTEVSQHLQEYVKSERRHSPFSWPTDGCTYEQHLKFVKWRNEHWVEDSPFTWEEFVLDYAKKLEKGEIQDLTTTSKPATLPNTKNMEDKT